MNDLISVAAKLNSRTAAEEVIGIGASVVEKLIWVLQHDAATVHRRYAAYALGKIRDPRAVEPLTLALRSDEPMVRENAAEALGSLGDARAVRPLLRALGDPAAVVRRYAERALVKIGLPSVMPLIEELWDPRAGVRDGVLSALARIGIPALLPLLHTIRYAGGSTRTDALHILGQLGDGTTLPRRVLAESRLPPAARAETLEAVLTYYDLPAPAVFCGHFLRDESAAVRAGAQAVLFELERRVLVRPCDGAMLYRENLLRPAAPGPDTTPHDTLLRPAALLPLHTHRPKRLLARLADRLRRI